MLPKALKLAIIGDPVAHSASPALQRGLLREAGIDGTYDIVRIVAGAAARGIDDLRAAGYTGLNVTTPLKEEAFERADSCDETARATRAVNTLVMTADRVDGFNTDGIGAIGALRDAGLHELPGARILVLGAGPTARAVVVALVALGAETTVWNRTRAKTNGIVAELGARPFERARSWDAVFATLPPGVDALEADVVTSIRAARVVIDANYGARSTLGAYMDRDVLDGASMLAASARASFALFRSVLHDGVRER